MASKNVFFFWKFKPTIKCLLFKFNSYRTLNWTKWFGWYVMDICRKQFFMEKYLTVPRPVEAACFNMWSNPLLDNSNTCSNVLHVYECNLTERRSGHLSYIISSLFFLQTKIGLRLKTPKKVYREQTKPLLCRDFTSQLDLSHWPTRVTSYDKFKKYISDF